MTEQTGAFDAPTPTGEGEPANPIEQTPEAIADAVAQAIAEAAAANAALGEDAP